MLAAFFRPKIKSQSKNQAKFAEELAIEPPLLSNYLNGKRPVPFDVLAKMAELTGVPLHFAVLANSAARLQQEYLTAVDQKKDEVAAAANKLLALLEDAPIHRGHFTLENFPDIAPGGWKVIMGDRREQPVQGLGDIGVLSSSCSDVMFLPALRLPPETVILSDKIFRLVPADEDLRHILRCNILSIGSPAVCLATRKILYKCGATFLFNIGQKDYEDDEKLINAIPPGELHDSEALEKYIQRPDVHGGIAGLLAKFREGGFVDPVNYAGIRGNNPGYNTDYGIIALARNPWSKDHLVCICAGTHAPGTAGAVQMLGQPREFEHRPWGGIVKVQIAEQARWESRFGHLRPKWETQEYDSNSYIKSLSKLHALIKSQEAILQQDSVAEKPMLKLISEIQSFVESDLLRRETSRAMGPAS